MASDIQGEKAANAQDLRDLQESYRKRRQETMKKGEQDLAEIRAETQKKVRTEGETGAAAINHLRREQEDKTEQIQRDGENRLTYQRKDIIKQFQNIKKAGDEQLEGLRAHIESKQDRLRRESSEADKREDNLRKTESTVTDDIQHRERDRRQAILKESQQEVSAIYDKEHAQKNKIKEDARQEIQHEGEIHRLRMKELTQQNQETFRRQQTLNESQLKNQIESDQSRLETERKDFLSRDGQLRQRTREALSEERENADRRMLKLTKQNDAQLAKERLRGTKDMEETRRRYSREIEHLHKEGSAEIGKLRENNRDSINSLKGQQKLQIEQLKDQHESEMQDLDQTYHARSRQNDVYYKQALLQQHLEFENKRKKNEETHRQELDLQKANLAKALDKQKRQMMDHAGKYTALKEDPFYRLSQVNGAIEDTGSHYVMKAEVPEHEKENVKVVVKNGQVVVEGHRRFKDRVQDERNTVSTENYQTFREEIPLEHPVLDKAVRRSWENGILTVQIPKA